MSDFNWQDMQRNNTLRRIAQQKEIENLVKAGIPYNKAKRQVENDALIGNLAFFVILAAIIGVAVCFTY